MTLPNIQVFGKPLEKLVETISQGIGIRYKPKATRNEADAEAYKIEVLAKAEAKALIIRSEAESEIALRAQERLFTLEINRQNNLENIIDKSIKHLDETVSETPVDDDWRTRFFNKAQDISTDELQEVWAKILANEIKSPGNISMRTLDVLCNLSKDEADLFLKLVSLKFSDIYVMKFGNGTNELNQFDITYGDILVLREAGLIFNQDDIHAKLDIEKNEDNINGAIIEFGNKKYFVTRKTATSTYNFPVLSFTSSGSEIASIINCKPNYLYLEGFIKYWSNKGYIFTE
jgi:hypothetical protein